MSAHRGVITFAAVIALGWAALLIAAASDRRPRASTLYVPNVAPVAMLSRGEEACQHGVSSPESFRGIEVWAYTAHGLGALDVTIRDSNTGQDIGDGRILVTPVGGAPGAPLDAAVAANRHVTICLLSGLPAPVTLIGSGAPPTTQLTINGQPVPTALSMVLLRAQSRSLLSLIPTVFRRASLFRPSWVGTWTFWLLASCVLISMVLGGMAIASAGRQDGARRD